MRRNRDLQRAMAAHICTVVHLGGGGGGIPSTFLVYDIKIRKSDTRCQIFRPILCCLLSRYFKTNTFLRYGTTARASCKNYLVVRKWRRKLGVFALHKLSSVSFSSKFGSGRVLTGYDRVFVRRYTCSNPVCCLVGPKTGSEPLCMPTIPEHTRRTLPGPNFAYR